MSWAVCSIACRSKVLFKIFGSSVSLLVPTQSAADYIGPSSPSTSVVSYFRSERNPETFASFWISFVDQSIATMGRFLDNLMKKRFEENKPRALQADIRMISGCEDSQTSADVSNVGYVEVSNTNMPWTVMFCCCVVFINQSPLKF